MAGFLASDTAMTLYVFLGIAAFAWAAMGLAGRYRRKAVSHSYELSNGATATVTSDEGVITGISLLTPGSDYTPLENFCGMKICLTSQRE